MSEPSFAPSALVAHAFHYARGVHADDRIKGDDLPYLRHLLEVVEVVAELGGTEEQLAAAMLHDTLEDHPETVTFDSLAVMFGRPVAEIVEACSDTHARPKPAWCRRKVRYVASIPTKPGAALTVSLADKIANARAILRDVLTPSVGLGVFERFSGGLAGTMWYYRALTGAFEARGMDVAHLERPVACLEELLGSRWEGFECAAHGVRSSEPPSDTLRNPGKACLIT